MRCLETGKSICLHFSGRNCDKKRHWSFKLKHFRISFVYPSSLSLFGTLADLAYFRDGAEWSMTSCSVPHAAPGAGPHVPAQGVAGRAVLHDSLQHLSHTAGHFHARLRCTSSSSITVGSQLVNMTCSVCIIYVCLCCSCLCMTP